MRYGAGAGASRLVSGTMRIHRRLEERLADFKRTEAALLFGSGYLANTGVIQALARKGEVVFSDALNHASIVDGCRLAGAETLRLRPRRRRAPGLGPRAGRAAAAALIVTDGVFSMDGDVAPLAEIVELAQRHDARVMVDEAHGTGAHRPRRARRGRGGGRRGRGRRDRRHARQGARLLRRLRVLRQADGQVPGEHRAHAHLLHRARRRPSVAGAMAALELLREQPRRVEKLQRNAGGAARGARRARACRCPASTQILPLVIGGADDAVARQRAGARAGRVRPGHPAAHRAGGHVAAAAHGDGLPHQVRAARRRPRTLASAARPPCRPRPGGRASAGPLARGVFDGLADAA